MVETKTDIFFYGLKDEFAYMSNFYKTNFVDENGINFNCSEQYFMYRKCLTFEPTNKSLIKEILKETSATKVKKLGRKVKNYDDDIWSKLRYGIMVEALRLKFSQNEDIKQKLINTGGKTLYEASKYDKIWGIGFYAVKAINIDKKLYGTNLLGKALMQVRDDLIKN